MPVTHTLNKAEIFRRIRESPQYAEREKKPRRNRVPQTDSMPAVVVGVYVVIAGGVGFVVTRNLFQTGGAWGFVPLIAVILGVVIYLFFPGKSDRISGGQIKVEPVIVIGKRAEVRGGRYASTNYYVAFEFESGKRRELAVYEGGLFGRISEEDAGVLYLRGSDEVGAAFLRGNYVADFERVQIE
ncbi:DUF2500 family protein [Bremerella cremea]|uniref:DUF2500 family protein n=1 Tax=Bremerella cremea TaxID=1031537 RepID=UPI001313E266|nr:DUF2500 family protein [Bremerella cremea]